MATLYESYKTVNNSDDYYGYTEDRDVYDDPNPTEFRGSIPVTVTGPTAAASQQSVVSGMGSAQASAQDPGYTIFNQGSQPTNSAANYPIESDYSWAGSWKSSLAKTGGASGIKRSATPYANITETKTVLPNRPQPTFAPPTYDEKEIRKKAKGIAAGPRAALEMKVQAAMSKYYENPNVRKMVLRETLAGYGVGLANVVGQAEQAATHQYEAQYAREYANAQNIYNIAMGKFLSEAKQVTAQRTVPTAAVYDKAMTTV